ncbi:hypothetical protein E2X65_24170 [Salmonella enterica]|nr:hypothetical protein [Salmonella enterica]
MLTQQIYRRSLNLRIQVKQMVYKQICYSCSFELH